MKMITMNVIEAGEMKQISVPRLFSDDAIVMNDSVLSALPKYASLTITLLNGRTFSYTIQRVIPPDGKKIYFDVILPNSVVSISASVLSEAEIAAMMKSGFNVKAKSTVPPADPDNKLSAEEEAAKKLEEALDELPM